MKNFLVKYKNIFVVLTFVFITYLFYLSYINTRSIIIEKNTFQKNLVKINILESLRYADNSFDILEKYLNNEMEQNSILMLEKYNHNSDILTWNLEDLKDQFEKYDIYILDKELKIIKTTFAEDLGLDFSDFPSFAALLQERLEGNNFISDRLDISPTTGKIKKYSYIPTPDNKYLFELSIDISKYFPALKELNIFSNAEIIKEEYDLIEDILFYKFNEDGSEIGLVSQEGGLYLDTDSISTRERDLVSKAISSNSIQVVSSNYNHTTQTEKSLEFIPYLNYFDDEYNDEQKAQLDWWSSYVVGITYDDSITEKELLRERNLFIAKITIISIVFVAFTFSLNYLINHTEKVASSDPLTGLVSRKHFMNYLSKLINNNTNNELVAVTFIDLNSFKYINDTHGHEAGDIVLKEVAKRLKSSLRKNDMVTRAGGDEFLVLINGLSSNRDVETIANKIKDLFSYPAIINDIEINIEASIGISVFPNDAVHPEELLQKADSAMYKAKKNKIPGSSDYEIY
ncbi:GGDEF domain-containing protein [Natranaerofaba carboxydovora]|uniref:GGDEF domain-containing protein n=1 Tax=Natranaerofaba carboxydovora TaxID=2742683 RepID=UPI001F142627|nr:GGDEF domain-containing protein [Natranaerofaba carboxydovora]UMZ74447.1 putative signaling protein [Natranaerofaba carboxydovora]